MPPPFPSVSALEDWPYAYHWLPCSLASIWVWPMRDPGRDWNKERRKRPGYLFHSPAYPLKAALSTWPSPSFISLGLRAVTASAGHCTLPVVSLPSPQTYTHSPSTKPSSTYPDLCYCFLLRPSLNHPLKVLHFLHEALQSSRELSHFALNSKISFLV